MQATASDNTISQAGFLVQSGPSVANDRNTNSVVSGAASLETYSHTESQTGSTDLKWWKILPHDLLKLGGILLVVPALTNIKTGFFQGDTSKAALAQSVVDSSRAVFTLLVIVQLGKLSDVVGRRPVIALSVLCSLFPLSCLAFYPDDLYYYMVVYALAGLLGGQLSPASQAYIADCCPQDSRARIYGLRGAFLSAIVMVMPGVSTMIEYKYGRQGVTTVAFSMQLGALVAVYFLPESLPKEKRETLIPSIGCGHLVKTLRQLSQRRGDILWDLSILEFLRGLCDGIPSFFAFKALLDLTDEDFALYITILGLAGILVQTVILRWMTRCGWSQLTMINFGIAVDVCGYLGYVSLATVRSKALLFVVSVIKALGRVYDPSLISLATQGIESEKGFVLGAFGAVDNVTSFVSPLLMGSFQYQVSPVAPFLLASLLNCLCLVFAFKLRARVAQAKLDKSDELVQVVLENPDSMIRGITQ
jgi:DHA1 family tetracycline resistance protein-like MFS transporter